MKAFCTDLLPLTSDSRFATFSVICCISLHKVVKEAEFIFDPVRFTLHLLNLLFDMAKIRYMRYAQYIHY
jgi:hypothetical protein